MTTIERIAKEHLGLETLKTRKSDGLDFHDLAVWQVKAALEAAYQAGREGAMTRSAKRQQIRAALYEAITLPYEKMETLVREWMQYPLSTFKESQAAGFVYPDAENPHVKK